MPWKNPSCEKCRGRTRQGELVGEKKCYYVCRDKKRCGHKQIGWRHIPDDPERDQRLRLAVEIARREKRRRL